LPQNQINKPMESSEEKKNKRLGMLLAIGIHSALLLLFLFMVAWSTPDPPLPEIGIELNFGTSNQGSGDVQPRQPITPTPNQEKAAPEEKSDVTPQDPVPVEATPATTPTKVQESTNKLESPDVVKPAKEEPKKVEEKKPVEPAKKQPTQTEQPKEVKKDGGSGDTGTKKTAQSTSQGDDLNKTGDKGDPKGSLDARALYGNQGGGGGFSVAMNGWQADKVPEPKDSSNETGRLVYEITINDEGDIIKIVLIQRGVSAAVESIYREALSKITFSKTSDNTRVAPTSTGRITFDIKSK
jgi:periplasmic protein TonB